jgi:hypothetical protein
MVRHLPRPGRIAGRPAPSGCRMKRAKTDKSFLLLFYKKEGLLFVNKKKQKNFARLWPHA